MPLPLLQKRSFSHLKRSVPHTEPPTQIKDDNAVPDGQKFPSQSSPFYTLPVELQVEIFLHCLPPFPTITSDQTPLNLAWVCHTWSVLVSNTPRLWSSFGIDIKGTGAAVIQRDVRLMGAVKLWLGRSKPYPLSIRLTHAPEVSGNESHRSAQVLALLITEARRWKHVDFTLPSGNIYVLQRVCRRDLPTLESFSLQTNGLFGSTGFLKFSLLHVPWRQITSVNLQLEQTLVNVDHCLKMLSHTNRLTECTLNLDCTMYRYDVPHDPVSLPSLQSLKLTVKRGSTHAEASLFRLLAALHTSKLQTLHLNWHAPQKRPPFTSSSGVLSFARNAGTLRELTIAYLPLSAHDLMALLDRVPNVARLTLKYALSDPGLDPITDAFLAACTVPPHASAPLSPSPPLSPSACVSSSQSWDGRLLLPKMERCAIECDGQGYTSAALVAFVRSRMAIGQESHSDRENGGADDDDDDDAVVDVNDGDDHLAAGPPSLRSTAMKSFRMLSGKVVLDGVHSLLREWRNDGMDIAIESFVLR